MQPTNFSRRFIKSYSTRVFENKNTKKVVDGFCDILKEAKKFILPIDGWTIEDPELRCLQDLDLHLPFKTIALEYFSEGLRVILGAAEDDGQILVCSAYGNKDGTWEISNPVVIFKDSWCVKNERTLLAYPSPAQVENCDSVPSCELWALLFFLNAVSCSNVSHERITHQKKQKKGCLEFDEYHVLVLRNKENTSLDQREFESKRSPREHLRRGHIRITASGMKVWVNSCVVSKGSKGRIFKDYEVKLH